MKVRIADHVLLVAPRSSGRDLVAGEEVEVDDATGREWLRRGWAIPAERKAQSAKRSAPESDTMR